MKTVVITLLAAALAFAQSGTSSASNSAKDASKAGASTKAAPSTQSKKAAPAAKPAPKGKPESAVLTIPAGATLVEPNLYRYTDPSGKTWNYRQTPFGVSKWEETATPGAQAAAQATASSQVKSEPVAVTDLGDSYRFEKKTPFGNSTWVHKKSELTNDEKAAVAANAKPAGNQ